MASIDTCCSIVPYFTVHEGKLEAFKSICEEFVTATDTEEGCLYYGFCFSGSQAHCREGYNNAQGVLAHLDNIGSIFERALQIANLDRLEIHGPEAELDQLRGPLEELSPQYFVLEYGFRR